MNQFKFVFLCFSILLIFLKLDASQTVNDSIYQKKIYFGFSFSPTYSLGDIKLNERAKIFNEYIYPIVLFNFNSKLIFNKIFGSCLNIRTGISLLNYGVKAGHIPELVGQDQHTYEYLYDSIDIKSTSTCISFPIGINKYIKNKKNILEIEAGIFNNIQLDVSYKAINPSGIYIPPIINPWLLGTKPYYLSIYFQFNYVIIFKNIGLEFSPIFNFTPYDISYSDVDEFIKFYQISLDIGLRF
jgi:hypothetical protein